MSNLKTITRWIAVVGLGLAGLVTLATHLNTPDNDRSAYFKYGNAPVMDGAWMEEAAAHDYIVLTPGVWEGREDQRADLIRRNPDIEFGTYFAMHTCPDWMQYGTPGSYVRRMWEHLSANLAADAKGDTAMIWTGAKWQPLWDIFDHAAVQGAVDILADYCRSEGVTVAFCDYASVPLACWTASNQGIRCDFNRNGIDQCVDPDERDQLRDAWFRYIGILRATLPQDVTIVVNGTLAYRDDAFLSALSGEAIYLEDYPQGIQGDPLEFIEKARGFGVDVWLDGAPTVADSMGCVDARWMP